MAEFQSIDIVILSLNRCDDTIATIASVLSQNGVGMDVWIIDQGSSKNSLEKLRIYINQLNNIHFIELGQNYGVPGGRNIGIGFGKADFIVCLDNDVILEDNYILEKIIRRFDSDAKLGCIGFRILNSHTKKIDSFSWVYPRSLKERSNEYFLATRFCGAGHAIRRNVFDSTGGYDASLFFYWEEVDLSNKIINLGYSIAYDPDISIYHKLSPDSRVNWSDKRFYYLVRNILYLDWKYYRSFYRIILLLLGYFFKGLHNNLLPQTLMGIKDGIIMANHLDKVRPMLSEYAKQYIFEYELSYRGNIFERIKQEVFEKINL